MDGGHDRPLLDEWVGGKVFLRYLGTPNPDEEKIDELANDPGALTLHSRLEVCSEYVFFERYDQFGIEVRDHPDRESEHANRIFLPWGAVLSILGKPPGTDD
jgi:hypothetical protein